MSHKPGAPCPNHDPIVPSCRIPLWQVDHQAVAGLVRPNTSSISRRKPMKAWKYMKIQKLQTAEFFTASNKSWIVRMPFQQVELQYEQ